VLVLLALLQGCSYGLSLPSDDPAPSGPAELGPTKQRVRKGLIPSPTPPPPEAVLTADRCGDIQHGGRTQDGCVTADIHCGESIIGHTLGGSNNFDTAFYRSKFCTPDTTNHDGGDERVYRLVMPEGDWHATITLDTPCADLDVAAILWNGDGCPNNAHIINRCEMWPNDGTAREKVEIVSQRESTWLVAVEGKDAEEGAFGLSVQCYRGLY
jgi:hypothetical protein